MWRRSPEPVPEPVPELGVGGSRHERDVHDEHEPVPVPGGAPGLSIVRALPLLLLLLVGGGCITQDMAEQPSYRPYEKSEFFADGRSARHPPEGTVHRGAVIADPQLTTGRVGARYVRELPFRITAADLARGRERYGIYCTPCHDQVGTGRGIVVQRGFRKARSYHSERLRAAAPGHFFDVMTWGMGMMPSFSHLLSPADRWRIVAWIRVLQLSQHAPVELLDDAQRARLQPPASDDEGGAGP